MTNEEIIKGLDLACSSITGSFMWTVNPFPILRDYIHRLQAENAALRERLEKSVELPCKVGDTIFYVQYFCDYKGCDSTTQQFCCGCKEMIEREKHKEKYVICEKSFVLKDLEKIGKKYFTTRKAAEARLAEMKGGAK